MAAIKLTSGLSVMAVDTEPFDKSESEPQVNVIGQVLKRNSKVMKEAIKVVIKL